MVDRIATFDEVLSGEAPRARARRLMAAEDEGVDLRADEAGDAPAEAAPDIFDFEREKRRRRTA
jgi:hypothetical protein